MKKKNDNIMRVSLIFQMESCKLSYTLWNMGSEGGSPVLDSINANCKVIKSDYRSIKTGEHVEFRFNVNPYLLNKDCNPGAFGSFYKENKKRHAQISVCPNFPARLDFILNRGLTPYFHLSCEKPRNDDLAVKWFNG